MVSMSCSASGVKVRRINGLMDGFCLTWGAVK
jgi:hypothetical protein